MGVDCTVCDVKASNYAKIGNFYYCVECYKKSHYASQTHQIPPIVEMQEEVPESPIVEMQEEIPESSTSALPFEVEEMVRMPLIETLNSNDSDDSSEIIAKINELTKLRLVVSNKINRCQKLRKDRLKDKQK